MYQVVSIEDDLQIAELLSFVLRHPKITIHTAHDGAAGLAMVRAVKPDLVLMDLMMPIMSGWEVYDAIRSDVALCKIPIIIVSVATVNHDRKRVLAESPIDDYFAKPFDARLLRGAIERMLDTSLWDLKPKPLRATGELEPDTVALMEAVARPPTTGPLPKVDTADKVGADQPTKPPVSEAQSAPHGTTDNQGT